MSALRPTTLFLLAGFAFIPLQATAWDRGTAELFATLPAGVRFPEGITANPASGDIFVGTFDVGTPNNQLLRFDRQGRLEASRAFGTTPLLGLEFDRNRRQVYIAAVGDFSGTGSRIQRIAANFKADTKIEEVALIPAIGAPGPRKVPNPDGSEDTITFGNAARVPNALTFDGAGNLYVSDSFQGAIFRIENPAKCAPSCVATTVVHDPLLATAGFPPFGANGIAFNRDESALFIANTGDDRVLKLDMQSRAVTVFAEGINGARSEEHTSELQSPCNLVCRRALRPCLHDALPISSCVATTVVHDPLLATAGFPPFGANGIAFNRDESALFIANTGDDRVLKLDMQSRAVTVFAEGINGA